MRELILGVLTHPGFLIIWGLLLLASLATLIYDLIARNCHMMSLMKAVWVFTVLYSGPLGLLVYWVSGRKEISDDATWRRGFRSTVHCYSGCGAGEIVGVFIAAGLLSMGNWGVAILTFALAYVAGFALTAGPLIQEGESVGAALWDAFVSESASITAMEVTAIGADPWLAQDATMGQATFWSSLVFSLSLGLLAAYPVNLMLIHFGLKEGMHSPKQMAHSQG